MKFAFHFQFFNIVWKKAIYGLHWETPMLGQINNEWKKTYEILKM